MQTESFCVLTVVSGTGSVVRPGTTGVTEPSSSSGVSPLLSRTLHSNTKAFHWLHHVFIFMRDKYGEIGHMN